MPIYVLPDGRIAVESFDDAIAIARRIAGHPASVAAPLEQTTVALATTPAPTRPSEPTSTATATASAPAPTEPDATVGTDLDGDGDSKRACAECGASLEGMRAHARFCSSGCKSTFNGRARRQGTAPSTKRACVVCGASLEGTRAGTKLCSRACSNKQYFARRKERERVAAPSTKSAEADDDEPAPPPRRPPEPSPPPAVVEETIDLEVDDEDADEADVVHEDLVDDDEPGAGDDLDDEPLELGGDDDEPRAPLRQQRIARPRRGPRKCACCRVRFAESGERTCVPCTDVCKQEESGAWSRGDDCPLLSGEPPPKKPSDRRSDRTRRLDDGLRAALDARVKHLSPEEIAALERARAERPARAAAPAPTARPMPRAAGNVLDF